MEISKILNPHKKQKLPPLEQLKNEKKHDFGFSILDENDILSLGPEAPELIIIQPVNPVRKCNKCGFNRNLCSCHRVEIFECICTVCNKWIKTNKPHKHLEHEKTCNKCKKSYRAIFFAPFTRTGKLSNTCAYCRKHSNNLSAKYYQARRNDPENPK